jgi:hypothetical protein
MAEHCDTCEHHEKHTTDISANKTTMIVVIAVAAGLGVLLMFILNGMANDDRANKDHMEDHEKNVTIKMEQVRKEMHTLSREVDKVKGSQETIMVYLESIMAHNNIPIIITKKKP